MFNAMHFFQNEVTMRSKEAAAVRELFKKGKAQRRRRRMIRKRERLERQESRRKNMIRQSMRRTRNVTPWIAIPRKMDEKMNLSRQAASAGKIIGIIRRSRKTVGMLMPPSLTSFQRTHEVAKNVCILMHMNKESRLYKKFTMPWSRKRRKHRGNILESPDSVLDLACLQESPPSPLPSPYSSTLVANVSESHPPLSFDPVPVVLTLPLCFRRRSHLRSALHLELKRRRSSK